MDCCDFSRPWNYSDLVLVCKGGATFHAHKSVVSMWSNTLAKEMTKWIEEYDANATCVELQLYDCDADDVLQFLRAIYPPNNTINDDNISVLLHMTNKLQSPCLHTHCEDHLLTKPPSLDLLLTAEKFKLLRLQNMCIEFASSIDETSLETDITFQRLSITTRLQVYRTKILLTRNKLEKMFIS